MSNIENALVSSIIEGIQNIKGKSISVLDLRKTDSTVCDYFVVCEGRSTTHISSIADAIEDNVREQLHERPFHIEGRQNAIWVLMDYGNVLVHIFQKEARDFYSIETLWDDAERIDIPDID